jgi:hypothetical protein
VEIKPFSLLLIKGTISFVSLIVVALLSSVHDDDGDDELIPRYSNSVFESSFIVTRD